MCSEMLSQSQKLRGRSQKVKDKTLLLHFGKEKLGVKRGKQEPRHQMCTYCRSWCKKGLSSLFFLK